MTSSDASVVVTRIRRATPEDLAPVVALLRDADLSIPGVEEHFADFLVAERGDRIIGAMGLELRGCDALLRSAVVAPDARGAGVASAMFSQVEELARASGVSTLVLLTTAAQRYWARHGFEEISRDEAPDSVKVSAEFAGACPASATVMLVRLE